MNFEISDWVMANTIEDELIHGFVDSMDVAQGIVRVHVTASDRETVIGKAIVVSHQDVKKLPVSSFDIEEQVKNVIDIALSTKDEQWFIELSEKLFAIQQNTNQQGEYAVVSSSYHNRLGVDQR